MHTFRCAPPQTSCKYAAVRCRQCACLEEPALALQEILEVQVCTDAIVLWGALFLVVP